MAQPKKWGKKLTVLEKIKWIETSLKQHQTPKQNFPNRESRDSKTWSDCHLMAIFVGDKIRWNRGVQPFPPKWPCQLPNICKKLLEDSGGSQTPQKKPMASTRKGGKSTRFSVNPGEISLKICWRFQKVSPRSTDFLPFQNWGQNSGKESLGTPSSKSQVGGVCRWKTCWKYDLPSGVIGGSNIARGYPQDILFFNAILMQCLSTNRYGHWVMNGDGQFHWMDIWMDFMVIYTALRPLR